MRRMPSLLFSVAAVVATLAVNDGVARADIAPPDSCSSPGQPCQNAGSAYNQAGNCVTTTCTKEIPAADGGLTPMTYSCNKCQLPGAAGSGGTGAGAGTGGSSTHTSGGSGCSVVGQTGGRHGAVLLGLVVAGLVAARLRRRTSV